MWGDEGQWDCTAKSMLIGRTLSTGRIHMKRLVVIKAFRMKRVWLLFKSNGFNKWYLWQIGHAGLTLALILVWWIMASVTRQECASCSFGLNGCDRAVMICVQRVVFRHRWHLFLHPLSAPLVSLQTGRVVLVKLPPRARFRFSLRGAAVRWEWVGQSLRRGVGGQ